MAGRPVDEMARINVRVPRGHQGFWDIIRELARDHSTFTARDVDARSNVRRQTVGDYLKRLEIAGYIEAVGTHKQEPFLVKTYRLIKDSRFAPRLTRSGQPATQGAGQDNMWRAMAMIGAFTARDLAVAATTDEVRVTPATALTYIMHLTRAGYLRRLRRAGRTKNQQATYRLYPGMKTGPLAPMIQRTKFVWDPNLGKVMGDGQEASS